jgi:hypothetical protein
MANENDAAAPYGRVNFGVGVMRPGTVELILEFPLRLPPDMTRMRLRWTPTQCLEFADLLIRKAQEAEMLPQ